MGTLSVYFHKKMVVVLLAAVLFCPPNTLALSELATLAELVEESDLIVTGQVISVGCDWNETEDGIFTFVLIEVDSVLKGSPVDTLEIKEYGGTVDTVTEIISEVACYALSERTLLFLTAFDIDSISGDTLNYMTVASEQGKLTILKNNDEEDVLFWDPSYYRNVVPADSLSPAYEGQPELLSDMIAAILSML
jgi:hypothetical protein